MAAEGQEKNQPNSGKCVLSPSMAGGPVGLGDPDDRTLRNIETVLIEKLMRERSLELCNPEKIVFDQCLERTKQGFFYKCRKEMLSMRRCQSDWMDNPEFKDKITEEYLDTRCEYRRTGITKWEKDKERNQQLEFELWLKQKREGLTSQTS